MTKAITNPDSLAHSASLDWTELQTKATKDAQHTFLSVVLNAPLQLDDAQLQAEEEQAEKRYTQALLDARRHRATAASSLLSAMCNWSRKQATALLREKVAGKPMSPNYPELFASDLQQQFTTVRSDLQHFWKQEDEQQAVVQQQRIAAQRKDAEEAFGTAYPIIHDLGELVLHGERERQSLFESGHRMANAWADKYEQSVKKREDQLAERVQLIQEQERENRQHQLSVRSLSRWDERNSFLDAVVSTGKNTVGCLLVWFLLLAGVLGALYLAFPHH
ncbi:hypothetical protein [Ktedonospora formicarum]|uniref:Uncharacterized protein n=1 Tax=Ktedonospora formicarum TaxID=2778364 RepID=A0A8J3ICU3_9CHLR|nr:hypothetical protein [Ktedonospora formicarum]GHO50850.1 hypothetical protein KSX_90130 [Ktedonospora formicarum]